MMPAALGMAGLAPCLFCLRKTQFAPWKSCLPEGSDPALEPQDGIFVVFFLAGLGQLNVTALQKAGFISISFPQRHFFFFSLSVLFQNLRRRGKFTQTLSGAVD